jgi:hypothetical protein
MTRRFKVLVRSCKRHPQSHARWHGGESRWRDQMYGFEIRTGAIFLTAEPTLKECIMFGKRYLLTKQLVASAALVLGVSGVALADDSSTNPSTENRGNLNMVAQSPCPQGTEASGTRQKKDEQKIESKSLPANRGTPIKYPYVQPYFQQYPGQ